MFPNTNTGSGGGSGWGIPPIYSPLKLQEMMPTPPEVKHVDMELWITFIISDTNLK